ncbi:hypothetical protein FRX31_020754 [Thalictrum thalictroides]|uniref:Uncharacterized protein n=1 Tax=Thalictrum thalictroides TaxID=46969 RepID=A0A7J6VX17_THATH|nr:hypothetical protein FRX31_020754 [Thalictrum thalictroides]
MLPADGTKNISFQRRIANGDLIIVYERHDNMKAIKVCDGSETWLLYTLKKELGFATIISKQW